MLRFFRWVGFGVAGILLLAVLAIGGLYLLIEISRLPHDHHTAWLDGPGNARIRGVSWEEGGSWFDDPRTEHEYTLVEPDGRETPIGSGPAPLDSEQVKLYEHGLDAELVVDDVAFRRTRSGRWNRFRATDQDFIYRHYAPLTEHSVHRRAHSWKSAFTGLRCRIDTVDLAAQRLTSACGSGARSVQLVFARETSEEPWVIDPEATFAESPPPERAQFPDVARATLTVLRAAPPKDLRTSALEGRPLEATLGEPGVAQVDRREFELRRGKAIEVPIEAPGFAASFEVEGAWMTATGWPVVFRPTRTLRAQRWNEDALVWHVNVPRAGASYLVYLRLEETVRTATAGAVSSAPGDARPSADTPSAAGTRATSP